MKNRIGTIIVKQVLLIKCFICSGLWAFGQRQESLGQFAINRMHNCTWKNMCLWFCCRIWMMRSC